MVVTLTTTMLELVEAVEDTGTLDELPGAIEVIVVTPITTLLELE